MCIMVEAKNYFFELLKNEVFKKETIQLNKCCFNIIRDNMYLNTIHNELFKNLIIGGAYVVYKQIMNQIL